MLEKVRKWSLEVKLFKLFKASIVDTGKSIDFYKFV